MIKNGNELDHLTRTLFKSASLELSADLSRRIMERIAKEQLLKSNGQTTVKMKSLTFSPWLLLVIIAYFLFIFLFMYIMSEGFKENSILLDTIKDKIPYLLTVVAVLLSLPFFNTIDRALS